MPWRRANRRYLLTECNYQALHLKRFGPKFEYQGAHFHEPGMGQRKSIVQRLEHFGPVCVEQSKRRVYPQRDAVERLRDRVVQLTGQTLPLFQRAALLDAQLPIRLASGAMPLRLVCAW